MDQMSTKQFRQSSTVNFKANYQRELGDTGPCQLHVVHSSFRKGVEGVQMWKICVLINTTSLSCHHQGGKIYRCTAKTESR